MSCAVCGHNVSVNFPYISSSKSVFVSKFALISTHACGYRMERGPLWVCTEQLMLIVPTVGPVSSQMIHLAPRDVP